MFKRLFILSLFIISLLNSQELDIKKTTSPEFMRHIWRAHWITHPSASTTEFGVFHFRREFQLENIPGEFTIHISADNRYHLFVNGESVCEGPARGDLHNWPYDTIDISKHLKTGKNVIAVQVVNFGEYKSGGQFSEQTALILQCENQPELDSGTEWQVLHNNGVHANPITPDSFKEYYQVLGFYAGGPCDSLIVKDYPWGWQQPDYDANNWPNARTIRPGNGRGFAYGSTWFLVPRPIDMLMEEILPLHSIERTNGISVEDEFLSGKKALSIPANSTVSILFDNQILTMGYPLLSFSGGKESTIKLTYAESLYDKNFIKGDRNAVSGKNIYGIFDVIKPDGGQNRQFRPLWLRTFRYLQIDVTTGNEPLTLDKFSHAFTAYPLQERAAFHSDDESLAEIWKSAWRGLQLCGRETFFSDAYFEQMQYIGDTRVQALATMAVSGDATLFKNALHQFDYSRVPNGLTQSRYPARELQIIPTYSLLYIAMIHDYFMYVNDPEFVKTLLPGIQSILAWFENHRDETGLVTGLDWWNFCDWATEYHVGMPPGADDGYSTLIALQYVYALQKAADIFSFFDQPQTATLYSQQADEIKEAVRRTCFDAAKGMYAETPERKQFSQHSNIFAVLTDTHPQKDQTELLEKVLDDASLIQTTFYFKFYLFEALQHCGMANAFNKQLDSWREFIKLGLSTFPEDDSETPRSDCHPWSSSPCFYLLTLTAGIQPAAPGFQSIVIEPALGPLKTVNATFPHPQGEIKITLKQSGKKGIRGNISIPKGLQKAVFKWGDKKMNLQAGEQKIKF